MHGFVVVTLVANDFCFRNSPLIVCLTTVLTCRSLSLSNAHYRFASMLSSNNKIVALIRMLNLVAVTIIVAPSNFTIYFAHFIHEILQNITNAVLNQFEFHAL